MALVRRIIPGPIRDALGIASPSKVTTRFGEQVAEGLAVGMTSGSPRVEAAATMLAGAAVPGMGGASGYRASAAGTGGPTINVYIGDQELRGIVRTEVAAGGRADRLVAAMTAAGVD